VQTNVLYYGDNLDILRRYIPDESVDLVYLDPPFNSNRDYNVIFKDESGRKSDAQLLAFEDTWHWGPDAEAQYAYLTNTARNQGRVPSTVSTIVAALRAGIGENQMMAYLVEMAVRLVELTRVLEPTGSLYLHCDPTASHYLKVLLDQIFGPECFRSEVVWKRSSAHSSSKRWSPVHDTVLFYTKGDTYTWNPSHQPLPQSTIDAWYNNVEAGTGRHFNRADLTAAGTRAGPSGSPWRGINPTAKGRHWAIPRFVKDIVGDLDTQAALDALEAAGRIFWPKSADGIPMLKRYIDEARGVPALDVIADISPLNNVAAERLGYPTQKPLALLERIIGASSNPGDLVLDPFCGCGTALVAAQTLERRWIGIDVTYLSIAVMKARLKDSFGLADVEVIGQPTEVDGARAMLQGAGLEGQYQFQWWALDLVGAQPIGGVERKGADRGIDGVISFSTGPHGEVGRALVSVKSGSVNSSQVRDLKGVLEREKAEIGLFVTLEEPSGPMQLEATTAGVYQSGLSGREYPRVQILTIRELLEEHRRPDLPVLVLPAYQQAERVAKKAAEQGELFG
jgi:site-specific DNA-methyltransferase (adenine-specific)